MDKNLLRAQLLMEAADLLNEESYEDYEDYEDYEELYESSRKPNTNERYAMAKGYVSKYDLENRDTAAKWHPEDYRRILSKAPGVAFAKKEIDRKNNTYTNKPSKALDRAREISLNRTKDWAEWHGDEDTKHGLHDRMNAADAVRDRIDRSRRETVGWDEDIGPVDSWKKTVRSEGKDPWRKYPRKGLFGK